MALCNLVRHEKPLPKEYQNFDTISFVENGDEGYYGGSVSLADHCPYIQEFTWRSKNVVVRGSQCRFEDNNPSELTCCLERTFNKINNYFFILEAEKNFALESYGTDSKCFDHSENMWEERSCRQTREWQHWGSGCYKYKCENRRLHILVSKFIFRFLIL